LSECVGVPIAMIGVGPARDQIIWTEAGRRTAPAQRAALA
jgi:adenylosuccinate synthase